MAQITIVYDFPDINITVALNGLKRMEPINGGETTKQYISRITSAYLMNTSMAGQNLLARDAIAGTIVDPKVTAS